MKGTEIEEKRYRRKRDRSASRCEARAICRAGARSFNGDEGPSFLIFLYFAGLDYVDVRVMRVCRSGSLGLGRVKYKLYFADVEREKLARIFCSGIFWFASESELKPKERAGGSKSAGIMYDLT